MPRDFNDVLREEGPEAARKLDGTAVKYQAADDNVISLDEMRRVWDQMPIGEAPEVADDAMPRQRDQGPLIKSSATFITDFVPPEYVVVGLLQRRFVYSFTGMTGSGKTSIALRPVASVALGIPFAGRDTEKVRVLYAAAENPDDVRMRWIALAQQMDFDPTEINVYFTDRRFKISEMKDLLRAEAEAIGGEFGFIVIDTSPAFFEGDDENNRWQMGTHALLLRSLTDTIPGRPCVFACCHPTKNADINNLLPAGGGTFLNEVDGNLTCIKTESASEVHWAGKFRGPEFGPLSFLLKTVTHQDLKDSDGRLLPTVICEALSDQAKDRIVETKGKDEDAVLALINPNSKITYRDIAAKMDWKLYSGEPHKTRAEQCVKSLIQARLIKRTRNGSHTLTEEGKATLAEGQL
jgi:hypothetical protein